MAISDHDQLDDWDKPLTRIVNHLVVEDQRNRVLQIAVALKKYYDKTGEVFSDFKKIVEVCTQKTPEAQLALKCLGFRGTYDYIIMSKDAEKCSDEYDLCILSRYINKRKLDNITTTRFIRVFENE